MLLSTFNPIRLLGDLNSCDRRRHNHRYGTIICDLERRRPISLLPDREPATAQAWLAGQPQIAIVARDPRRRLCRGCGESAGRHAPPARLPVRLPHCIEKCPAGVLHKMPAVCNLGGVRPPMISSSTLAVRAASPPNAVNMKVTYGARTPTPPFSHKLKRTPRSRRSCAEQGIAGVWSGGCLPVSGRMCSGFARVRSTPPVMARCAMGRRTSQWR